MTAAYENLLCPTDSNTLGEAVKHGLDAGETLFCKILLNAGFHNFGKLPDLLVLKAEYMIRCSRREEAAEALEEAAYLDPRNARIPEALLKMQSLSFPPIGTRPKQEVFSSAYTRQIIKLLQLIASSVNQGVPQIGLAISNELFSLGINKFPTFHFLRARCFFACSAYFHALGAALIELSIDDGNLIAKSIAQSSLKNGAYAELVDRGKREPLEILALWNETEQRSGEFLGSESARSVCYMALGNLVDAIESIRKELARNPEDKLARALIEELKIELEGPHLQ